MAKVSIDATWLGGSKTGTAVYLLEILNQWNLDKNINHEFIIFRPNISEVNFEILKLDHRFKFIDSPRHRGIRVLWQQFIMGLLINKLGANVHWGAGFILPKLCNCPMVLTVHDLTFHKFPETHEFIKRIYFPYMIKRAVKLAKNIMAISETTRNDLIEIYPGATQKVHVTTLAARSIGQQSVLAELGEPALPAGLKESSYFLFVGTIEPRKNLSRLLDAWITLNPKQRGHLKLVVVGLSGWMVNEVLELMDSTARDVVVYLNYVSDGELNSLMNGALALVYPSLYEGFGLPVLEAMSKGVPVITSAAGATLEVASDAAVLIDPYSVESIQDGLLQIMNQNDLRKKLSEMGIKRASIYTWEQTALATLSVLEQSLSHSVEA